MRLLLADLQEQRDDCCILQLTQVIDIGFWLVQMFVSRVGGWENMQLPTIATQINETSGCILENSKIATAITRSQHFQQCVNQFSISQTRGVSCKMEKS